MIIKRNSIKSHYESRSHLFVFHYIPLTINPVENIQRVSLQNRVSVAKNFVK